MLQRTPTLYLALILTIALLGCARGQSALKSERDFQLAFHRDFLHSQGRLEFPVPYGRVDILTNDFAIEVDDLDKFHEGIGQALHYAEATGRQPGLALFVVRSTDMNSDKLEYVKKLCAYYGITVWYINEELEKRSRR
jgi:hypothetical protein